MDLQGKDFWLRYVLTYRSFSSHHGFIGRTAPTLPHFSELVDWVFIRMHEIFVDGERSFTVIMAFKLYIQLLQLIVQVTVTVL